MHVSQGGESSRKHVRELEKRSKKKVLFKHVMSNYALLTNQGGWGTNLLMIYWTQNLNSTAQSLKRKAYESQNINRNKKRNITEYNEIDGR